MKSILSKIIFFISLVANVAMIAFAARIGYHFGRLETVEGRVAVMADRFDLSAGQREEILRASQTYQAAEQVYLERIQRADADLLREGPAAAPDYGKLRSAIDEIYSVRTALGPVRRDLALRILRILEPEQRARVFELRKKPPAHFRGPPLGPILELLPPAPIEFSLP